MSFVYLGCQARNHLIDAISLNVRSQKLSVFNGEEENVIYDAPLGCRSYVCGVEIERVKKRRGVGSQIDIMQPSTRAVPTAEENKGTVFISL